jgi:hypothetical protein
LHEFGELKDNAIAKLLGKVWQLVELPSTSPFAAYHEMFSLQSRAVRPHTLQLVRSDHGS